MKKLININLSGRIIKITYRASHIYLAYIETLRDYFINEEGGFEIVNDIENRIAELMEKIVKGQGLSIKERDIENIIRIMGTTNDLKELDAEDHEMSLDSGEYHYIQGNILYNFDKSSCCN